MRPRPHLAPAHAPAAPPASLLAEVVAGLAATPKRLPPKLFYDAEGSRLFERITRLPEYYPTRTELGILRGNAAAIAAFVPPGAALIEFGAGSSAKARVLLDALPALGAYVPVDISGEFLGAHQAAPGFRRSVRGPLSSPSALNRSTLSLGPEMTISAPSRSTVLGVA